MLKSSINKICRNKYIEVIKRLKSISNIIIKCTMLSNGSP